MLDIGLAADRWLTIDHFAERLEGLGELVRYDEPDLYATYERLGWSLEREDALQVICSNAYCDISLCPLEEDPGMLEQLVVQDIQIAQPRVYGVTYNHIDLLVKVLERVADRDDIWIDYGLGEYTVGSELVAKLAGGWRWRLPMSAIDIAVRVSPRKW